MSVRKILVAAAAVAALALPAVAHGATIRVTAPSGGLLGNLAWTSGSARAYVDDAGTAHTLPANTALGQLVAATAFRSTPLVVGEFPDLGPYVKSIGTAKLGPKAAWDVYVNGATPQLGAGVLVLKKSDQVIWFLDTDYSRKGPTILDLAYRAGADGTVTFTVRKASGTGFTAAKGATVVVDGTAVGTTNAKGVLVLTLAADADWDEAHATMKGAIGSQSVVEAPCTGCALASY